MLLLSNDIVGKPVASLHVGHPVAQLGMPIIKPHSPTIEAFYCSGPKFQGNTHALLTQDIRELSNQGALIDSTEDIVPIQDLLRLQKLIKINYQLIGKPAYTESGRRLGKVEEYVFLAENFKIQKLHVKQSVLRSMSRSNLIVDRTQIVNVTDKKIVVKDATVKDAAPAVATPSPT